MISVVVARIIVLAVVPLSLMGDGTNTDFDISSLRNPKSSEISSQIREKQQN
jgi:hypothetical protein